ncbi:hypothetical protein E2C01_035899 [Portunus trituberculatus]|uniref:Uncharacterized protein n=1 Tax=Portunus trituberculatus TaxID=210409 RepID=A0A5B7F4D5_PORTR|nr:hypothetical protein [Portunus trituberculatus]
MSRASSSRSLQQDMNGSHTPFLYAWIGTGRDGGTVLRVSGATLAYARPTPRHTPSITPPAADLSIPGLTIALSCLVNVPPQQYLTPPRPQSWPP